MLHILNGDATANILKQTDLPGIYLPWREALMMGPTPPGQSHEDWLTLRAHYLAEAYEQKAPECKKNLRQQEQFLYTFSNHREVTLWFEYDLFCQINLIYLLNWFAKQKSGNTHFSLICIDQFPGVKNFRGLGQLRPEQLAALFDKRQAVQEATFKLAEEAWAAYCSPNPTAIEEFIQTDTSALPFLHSALCAHLARLPSVRNGLGHIAEQALELIAAGIDEFTPLFHTFCELEPVYGLGDWQFWVDLKQLSLLKNPLIDIMVAGDVNQALLKGTYTKAAFKITEQGTQVLKGELDFADMNGIDLWLGGVHLSSKDFQLWHWDEAKQKIVAQAS